MGRSRDTGYLRNLLTYDANGNITTTGTLSGPAGVVYATQSYVGTQLAALVGSAPATLDTLNELAAALGSDPNFATTVTNSIATKLPLAGGTLTGALTISSPTHGYLNLTAVNAGGNEAGIFFNINGNKWEQYTAANDLAMNWYSYSATAIVMKLTPDGKLGIGTTTPDSGLNINSGATRGLRIDVNSGVQAISINPNGVFGIDEPGIGNGRFIINTNGNVGIQTGSPANYSGFTTLHINGKSGANGGVLRLTAYDSTSSGNIYAGANAFNINTTSAVPIKFLTRDTLRMQILDNGAVNIGWGLGNQYSQTSGGGSGTSIVDTGITYNSGDYGGYGRGATYQVVFNGNPNAGGSGAYFAQYAGILMLYTGWSGSAVTTYINYTQLATGNNISTLTLTPVFWNGSSESSSIGVYTTGVQIRLKISGYNSSYTGSDQSVYLKRLS